MNGPDFPRVNAAALSALPALLDRWLPGGRRQGAEYVARNPTRTDRRPGSFTINTRTGRWADFATGDRGGDVVSLAAYLHGLRQAEAARKLADMLGMAP
jgi:DNA primase